MTENNEAKNQLEVNLDIATLLNLTPEGLAKHKHDILKSHVLLRLRQAIDLIEREDYLSLYDDLIEHSEAGDSYTPGSSNYYINLAYVKDETLDISQAVDRLERFKKEAGVPTE